jgi:hypothetical protein
VIHSSIWGNKLLGISLTKNFHLYRKNYKIFRKEIEDLNKGRANAILTGYVIYSCYNVSSSKMDYRFSIKSQQRRVCMCVIGQMYPKIFMEMQRAKKDLGTFDLAKNNKVGCLPVIKTYSYNNDSVKV